MILGISIGMSTPYFSLYVLSQGGEPEVIGLVNALGALASVVTSPVAGYVADRFGRVKIIVVFSAFQGIVNLLYVVAWDWHLLALGSLLLGLLVLQIPALSAIVADSLPPRRRGIGFASASFVPGVLRTIAPLLGGYLIAQFGLNPTMRYMYFFVFLSLLAVALIRHKFLEETVQRNVDLPARKPILLIKDAYKDASETLKWMTVDLKLFGLIMAQSFFFNSLTGPFWVVYTTKIIGLDTFEWGMITSLTGVLSLVLTMPVGIMVDRYGEKRVILMGLVLSILPTFYFIYSQTFIEVLMVLLALRVSNALLGPSCRALMADLTPRERRGRITAAIGQGSLGTQTAKVAQGNPGFILALFSFAGFFVGGYIYDLNPAYPWFFLTISVATSLGLTMFLLKEPEKPEE